MALHDIERLERDMEIDPVTGCWRRTAGVHRNGYTNISGEVAHRFAYLTYVGPIPEGHEIHHLCGVRCCVNPEHLEALTRAEHLAKHFAEARCRNGHLLAETGIKNGGGKRRCGVCLKAKRSPASTTDASGVLQERSLSPTKELGSSVA